MTLLIEKLVIAVIPYYWTFTSSTSCFPSGIGGVYSFGSFLAENYSVLQSRTNFGAISQVESQIVTIVGRLLNLAFI